MNVPALKSYLITEAVVQERYPALGKRLDLVHATSAREALVRYVEHHDPPFELGVIFEYGERVASATIAEDQSKVVALEWLVEHDGSDDADLGPGDAQDVRSTPGDDRSLATANAAHVRELMEEREAIAKGWEVWKKRLAEVEAERDEWKRRAEGKSDPSGR